jgi:predicted nucleic acid-binding Zn ribbon protein
MHLHQEIIKRSRKRNGNIQLILSMIKIKMINMMVGMKDLKTMDGDL